MAVQTTSQIIRMLSSIGVSLFNGIAHLTLLNGWYLFRLLLVSSTPFSSTPVSSISLNCVFHEILMAKLMMTLWIILSGHALMEILVSGISSLVPRPCPVFRRLQYGKVGEGTASNGKLGGAWERGYGMSTCLTVRAQITLKGGTAELRPWQERPTWTFLKWSNYSRQNNLIWKPAFSSLLQEEQWEVRGQAGRERKKE